MKFCPYNLTIFFFVALSLTSISCKKAETREDVLLSEAQLLLDDKPKEALALLDSIISPKTTLSKDRYMQYIVANTYARFTNGFNIAQDTLIFEAVTYFEKTKNEKQLAVAYLYAGNVHNIKGERENAFMLYIKSCDLAKKNKDLFTESKGIYNIGSYFYKNNLQDSAIVYLEKSLNNFRKLDNKDNITTNLYALAISNFMIDNLQDAKKYNNEAFSLASELDLKIIQYASRNNLGRVADAEGNYKQSLKYLNEALLYTNDTLLQTKTIMNIADMYMHQNKLDSSTYYINIIEERVPQIKDLYTLRSMCASLYNYYTKLPNYQLANYYGDMRRNLKQLIDDKKITDKIQAIDKDRAIEQYKEATSQKHEWYIYCLSLVAISIIVLYTLNRIKSKRQIILLKDNIKRLKNEI